MSERGSKLVLVCLAVAAAFITTRLLWVAIAPAPAPASTAAQRVDHEARLSAWDARREAATYVNCAPGLIEPVAAGFRALIEDEHQLATSEMEAELADLLAGYVVARSEEDSGVYMALADDPDRPWITEEDDEAWRPIIMRYQYITGRSPQRTNPREALATIMDHCLQKERARILRVGAGEDSCRIIIHRLRDIETINDPAFTDTEEVLYWLASSTGSALFFRRPATPAADAFSRDGSLLMAECMLTVRIGQVGSDRPSTIYSKWFWDRERQTWQCERMFAKGRYLHGLQY